MDFLARPGRMAYLVARMNGTRSDRHLYSIALVAGAALWLATTAISGRHEAWDSPLYWQVAYPVCIAVAAYLGYLGPTRSWRWAVAVMLIQAIVMALTSGSSLGLLPLGFIVFCVLALPLIAAARIGSLLHRGRTVRR